MKIFTLIFVAFLAGCNATDNLIITDDHEGILAFGGSNCDDSYKENWASMLNLSRNCQAGRQVHTVDQLPVGFHTVIFALGTNESKRNFDVDAYKANIERLLNDVTSVCILPYVEGESFTEPYRNAMREVCDHTIAPEDVGAEVIEDGVHYTEQGHANLATAVSDYL